MSGSSLNNNCYSSTVGVNAQPPSCPRGRFSKRDNYELIAVICPLSLLPRLVQYSGMSKKQPPALFFAAAFEPAAADGLRRFSGVAYSGGLVPNHYAWGDLVFDLSSMTLPERTPVLIEHDRLQRAGVVDMFSIGDDGLTVTGFLLDNDAGRAVAAESDAGFPWQMSVHIEPLEIAQLAGQTVNGVTYKNKTTIFKNSSIREVSFTPTGADKNTSAQVFSFQPTIIDEGLIMTEEEIAALQAENAMLKAKVQELSAKLSEIEAEKRADEMEEATGEEVAAEDAAVLASMSKEAFAFALKAATKKAPVPSSMLFSEQATRENDNKNNSAALAGISQVFKL